LIECVKNELRRPESGHPIQSLALTVGEDRPTLDDATDAQQLFTAWTHYQEAIEERETILQNGVGSSPRYDYCELIDARAFNGCLGYEGLAGEKQQFLKERRDLAIGEAAYLHLAENILPRIGANEGNEGEGEEYEDQEEEEPAEAKLHMPMVLP